MGIIYEVESTDLSVNVYQGLFWKSQSETTSALRQHKRGLVVL